MYRIFCESFENYKKTFDKENYFILLTMIITVTMIKKVKQ